MKGKRILVVDDTEGIRYSIRPVLELAGYEVSVASNGLEAVKKIEKNIPDLLLLDLMMPEMDGWDVLKELKKKKIKLKVVMMTARSDKGTQQLSQKVYGVKGFITKPFHNKDLIALIRKVMDAS